MSKPKSDRGDVDGSRMPGGMDLLHEFQIGLSRAVLQGQHDQVHALQMLGHALSRRGRHEEALAIDHRITTLLPRDPTAYYNLACSYSNLKDVDHALETLERALRLGYKDLSHMLRDDDLKSVRSDPRFQKLIDRKWGKRRSSR